MTRWFLLFGMLLIPYGCGGDDRAQQLPPDGKAGSPSFGGRSSQAEAGAGGDKTSIEGGAAGQGGEGGAPFQADERAPIVEILTPAAVLDPDEGEVLTGSNVQVSCRVRRSDAPNSELVDTTSVTIAALDATGKLLKEQPGTSDTVNALDNEYIAQFAISSYPSGRISFRCAATDDSEARRQRSHQISTFLDKGPKITLIKPTNDDKVPYEGQYSFEFLVDPVPLSDNDDGAEVGTVSLNLGDSEFEVTPDPKQPGFYSIPINFSEQQIAPGKLLARVNAANRRKPEPVIATLGYELSVDGEGPVITVTSPGPDTIIGNRMTLTFTVADAVSEVDASSVEVTVNGAQSYTYVTGDSHWSTANKQFIFVLDSSEIEGVVSEITVNISAKDVVGNESDSASLFLYLDHFAPIVDLDPENITIVRPYAGTTACSTPFDVLGDALSDLAETPIFNTFRAAVWDRTNQGAGQERLHYSGVRRDSVILYAQWDHSKPLFIDANLNDDDDSCTTMNIEGTTPLRFEPVTTSRGTPPEELVCDKGVSEPRGEAVPAPKTLCDERSDLTFNPHHVAEDDFDSSPPALYGKEPQKSRHVCTGDEWEIGSVFPKGSNLGWVCLGAVATDNAGNVGYSNPIRVCVTDVPSENGDCFGVPPPSCADRCVPRFPRFPTLIDYDATKSW